MLRESETTLFQELFLVSSACGFGFKRCSKSWVTDIELNDIHTMDLGTNLDHLEIHHYTPYNYDIGYSAIPLIQSEILFSIRRARIIGLYCRKEESEDMPLSRFIHLLEKVDDL